MATETLRPNAAGDDCNIYGQGCVACPNHYTCVDEETPDEATTTVGQATKYSDWYRDLYNIADSTGAGAINFIKVYARCKAGDTPGRTNLKIAIKSGTGTGAPNTVDESSELTTTDAWANYSNQWNTNPATSSAWTWDEIDKLQAGIAIRGYNPSYVGWTWCTQVWVEVDYIGVIEKSSSDTGSGTEASSLGATLSRPDSGSGTEGTPTQAAVLAKSDSGSGFDALTSLLAALAKSETGSGADAYVEVVTIEQELSSSDVGAGIDALAALNIALVQSDAGTGSEALLSRLLHHADSGLGADACLTLLATLARAEIGSGLDAFTGLITALAASETGLGVDKLLGRGISLFDAGSGLDAATLCKAFYSTDYGVGLEALATLLALITTSEIGSGSEKFRAKIMTSAGAYDMKLPTKMGQAEIPPKGVNS